MQKIKLSNLSEGDNFQGLPSIKTRLKPSSTTPRIYLAKSPVGEQQSFSPMPVTVLTPVSPEELLFTRMDEGGKKKFSSKITSLKDSESIPLKKKLTILTQKNAEQEKYIKALENRINEEKRTYDRKITGIEADYMHETISSQNKKGEIIKSLEKADNEDNIKDPNSRHKYKDYEIGILKQEIEEFNLKINNLHGDLHFFKDRNKELEDKLNKNQAKIAEYETERKKIQNNLKFFETKANENELEYIYKQSELEDLHILLKKCEEKRKLTIELNSSLENKCSSLKIKVSNLNRLKLEQEEDISRLTKECIEKDSQIEHLSSHVSYLELTLEQEKNKINLLQMETEKVKSILSSSDERFLSKIERLEKDNQMLQESLMYFQHNTSNSSNRNISKRSETQIESKYLTKLTADEIARWQQRYFLAEQELLSKYTELEKKSKDEQYLHNQIDTKNFLINRLEGIIQQADAPSPSMRTNSSSLQVNYFYELLVIIEKMNRRYQDFIENLKCPSCFKLKTEYFLSYPCIHLCCKACKTEGDVICGKCAEKVNFLIPASYISGFIQISCEEKEDLNALKTMIMSANYALEAE